MKNLLLITVVFGALAMTSCSKNRSCELNGENMSGSTEGYSKDQVKEAKAACKEAGGKWKMS